MSIASVPALATSTSTSTTTTTTEQQTKPQSKRHLRRQKRLTADEQDLVTALPLSIPSPPLTPTTRAPTRIHTISPSMPSNTTRLLIASVGNPAPYLSTLHSAGHTLLLALASLRSSQGMQPPLHKGGREWAQGLLSHGDEYTLWMSPVAMNISGTALSTAWRAFQSASRGPSTSSRDAALVVIHDELEAPLGAIKIRDGTTSAKGHNGLKSIAERMPGVRYTRIGIGIGRPEARDPETVAAYVLRKMTGREREAIEACAERVDGELRRLGGG